MADTGAQPVAVIRAVAHTLTAAHAAANTAAQSAAHSAAHAGADGHTQPSTDLYSDASAFAAPDECAESSSELCPFAPAHPASKYTSDSFAFGYTHRTPITGSIVSTLS